MLMLGKPELVHELDNNLMELRTSLDDINNISNFYFDIFKNLDGDPHNLLKLYRPSKERLLSVKWFPPYLSISTCVLGNHETSLLITVNICFG